MIVLDNTK